jgi:hypothetical protein
VHEKENDENSFAGSNYESHDDVQAVKVRIEVHGCGVDSRNRQNHQHSENQKIDFWRNNMLGHACLS